MNTAAKGRRNEHRSIRHFEALGYVCVRAAGSKGPWDFVGISREGIVLVQVKSTRWPSRKECAMLAALPVPVNAVKVLHRWRKHARKPDVRHL
jgi:hypothetical protein